MAVKPSRRDPVVAHPLETFPITLVLSLEHVHQNHSDYIPSAFFERFLHAARVEHQALALVPPPRPPGTHSSSPQAQSTAESPLREDNIPASQEGKQRVASPQSQVHRQRLRKDQVPLMVVRTAVWRT